MENLKLEMIDFIMKNKEIEETDMIFSFNSGEIKVYLDYQTGELKDTVYCDNQEEIKNKIKLSIPLKLIGSATFSYEYGLYEYVQIDMEDKLEKYLYNDKKIYILNEKEIFLELQISEKESLFFNEEYFLIGFGIEKETSSLIDNKIENETEKNKNKKPIEQTYDSIRNWLLPLLRKYFFLNCCGVSFFSTSFSSIFFTTSSSTSIPSISPKAFITSYPLIVLSSSNFTQ